MTDWRRDWLLGGWSPNFSRSYWTILLAFVTVVGCAVQSLMGWQVVMSAIGFVPSAVWAPSSWFFIWPGQSLPVVLTWLTYVFPHMGWGHMASNVFGLLIFGSVVEPMMGTRRYIALTAVGSVLGVFGLAAVHPLGTTAIAGGSLLLCTIIGVWFAAFSQAYWHTHRLWTVALEGTAVASLAAWIVLRVPSSDASGLMGALWHVPPLFVGWFGFRIASALQSHAGRPSAE